MCGCGCHHFLLLSSQLFMFQSSLITFTLGLPVTIIIVLTVYTPQNSIQPEDGGGRKALSPRCLYSVQNYVDFERARQQCSDTAPLYICCNCLSGNSHRIGGGLVVPRRLETAATAVNIPLWMYMYADLMAMYICSTVCVLVLIMTTPKHVAH